MDEEEEEESWIRRRVNFCFFWRGGIHLYFYQDKCVIVEACFQERTAFSLQQFSQISVESLPDSSFLLSSVPYPSLPCFLPRGRQRGKGRRKT